MGAIVLMKCGLIMRVHFEHLRVRENWKFV